MTAQQAGGRSRGEFLRKVTLAGAVDVFGVSPRSLAAVEEKQTGVQTDKPSALGVYPQRYANAHERCPNCGEDRYEAR
jgi:hypothetical protein